MKSEFTTPNGTVKIYPSSNIYQRFWISIEESLSEKSAAIELSKWDIDILISILKKAKKSLDEAED